MTIVVACAKKVWEEVKPYWEQIFRTKIRTKLCA